MGRQSHVRRKQQVNKKQNNPLCYFTLRTRQMILLVFLESSWIVISPLSCILCDCILCYFRLFQNFCFSHFPVIESHMLRLKRRIEKALTCHQGVVGSFQIRVLNVCTCNYCQCIISDITNYVTGTTQCFNPFSPRLAKTIHFVILLCLTQG